MILPDKRPEEGPLGLANDRRVINQLIDYARSLTPQMSDTVQPEWTASGTKNNSKIIQQGSISFSICDSDTGDLYIATVSGSLKKVE